MKDYLLFIDTEASDLPKDWCLPYSVEGNWPYSVQISWVVYTKGGDKIKEENHYISDTDFTIAKSATKVHGITRKLLDEKGEPRQKVMQLLTEDITRYDPLIVGHFMDFDQRMIGADYYRCGSDNKVLKENAFCTMVATKHLSKNPAVLFLKLPALYKLLFNQKFEKEHDAIEDARATAACFFELVKRGEITEETIKAQQLEVVEKLQEGKNKEGCMPLLAILFLIIIIITFV